MVSPLVEDELVRAEIGYAGAAAALCAGLALVYRWSGRAEAAAGR